MSRQVNEKRSMENRSRLPVDHEMVQAMAYQLWLQRGCPTGTEQEDWFRAEKELTSASRAKVRAA